jgi:hypothetical protein
MAGRHRRVERRGRVWLINFGVLGLALDALLTPMAGGAEGAPRLLFLFWSVVVMMRTVPRWRSRAAQTCKWLGGACAAWFMATMNLGLPNGQLFWLNSAALWGLLAAVSSISAWLLRDRKARIARHAA